MVESGEQVYSIAVHLSSHRQEVASTAVGMTSYWASLCSEALVRIDQLGEEQIHRKW